MQLTWDDICADPCLRNLPYKIETNRWGQIVMSPAKRWHSKRQGKIAGLLNELAATGHVYAELAVQTTEGVKVMDVGWGSDVFDRAHAEEDTLTAAPELCIEVLSGSNSKEEVQEKITLYFAYGAQEVWLCDDKSRMSFYIAPTQMAAESKLFPKFPAWLEIK